MGMYGALIVLPKTVPANCTSGLAASNLIAEGTSGETDFRLAASAYDHPSTCYDREYLFQFSEMDDNIHSQAEAQVLADLAKPVGLQCKVPTGCLEIATEPYLPDYYMVNGRSMPDDMDPELRGHVSEPAVQRQSAHASRRAHAGAHHWPGTMAASFP